MTAPPPGPATRRVRSTASAVLGWLGVVAVVSFGLAASGLSGLLLVSGLLVLAVGGVALLRGHVVWARLGSRTAGASAVVLSLALLGAGGAVAGDPVTPDPPPAPSAPPTTRAPSASGTTGPARPGSSPAASSAPRRVDRGTALAGVRRLRVAGRSPMTGYDREQFGQAWFDADRNGCDTRNDVLRRDLAERTMRNSCKVLAGTLGPDPYTGTDVRFVYGGASEVDVDHVVALGDAWQKGASQWPAGKRLALANDPLNLLATESGTNRSKGDGDTATWLPPDRSFRCDYVARQVAVKRKYALRVTSAERDAMIRVLGACPGTPLPEPGAAPTVAALPRSRITPAPESSPRPLLRQRAPRSGTRRAPAPAPVYPGAFCAPRGAAGVTEKGTAMSCRTKPGDDRARWRSG